MRAQAALAADMMHMRHALHLARRALGRAAPNPAVGCVVVRDGQAVGCGWTQPGGRPHAETQALADAGAAARGACAYVTLEPCAHQGETGACADALIKAGIARVVYAVADPDARVQGRGAARLRAAGIAVRAGVERAAAVRLNRGFFLRVQEARPLFAAKLATSRDGESIVPKGWITQTAARRCGHMLRAEHDGILVGRRTVAKDKPQLTCRLPGMEDASPQAIVLDTKLSLSPRLSLWRSKRPIWLCHGEDASYSRRRRFASLGVRLACIKQDADGRLAPAKLAQHLAAQGFTRVLLEGGAQTIRSFLAAGLVDEVAWFRAPHALRGGKPASMRRIFPPPSGGQWQLQEVRRLGVDEGRFYQWQADKRARAAKRERV